MAILALPAVAGTVARVFAHTVNPTPKGAVRFADIPGRTSQATVPTRYGPVTATLYHPPNDVESPPVYVDVHGGGFVAGHPGQDDPWCRYLAAGVVAVDPITYWQRISFPRCAATAYDVVRSAARAGRNWDGNRRCVGG